MITKQPITPTVSISGFPLPLPYRLFFLLIEPLATLAGAYYAHFDQQTYLTLSHAPSAPFTIPLGMSITMSQLGNMYFAFAMIEALVLRSTSDLRVWKTLLFCLLVADVGHLLSIRALGTQIYWNVAVWNAIDWGNVLFVYVGASMRIAFLMGLGFPKVGKGKSV